MTEKPPNYIDSDKDPKRADRLKQALRDNLKRRKTASRRQKETSKPVIDDEKLHSD